ncbi:hypothetical protein D3C71_1690480 [compost metagenome]
MSGINGIAGNFSTRTPDSPRYTTARLRRGASPISSLRAATSIQSAALPAVTKSLRPLKRKSARRVCMSAGRRLRCSVAHKAPRLCGALGHNMRNAAWYPTRKACPGVAIMRPPRTANSKGETPPRTSSKFA